jgi:glutathione S-transferase
MENSMKLYELSLSEGRTVSPFVWRTRYCLAHKGLDPERVPISYHDKDQLEFSGQDRVPVLVDGDTVVSDSWNIACYLEDAYQDAPGLFGNDIARGMGLAFNRWCDHVLLGSLFLVCSPGTYDLTQEEDKPYFAQSRFEWTGKTIDEIRALESQALETHRKGLEPLRQTLAEQPFISGDAPAFADFCVMGGFMWAKTTYAGLLLNNDDPVEEWRQKMLDLFGGLGRGAVSMG